LQGLWLHPVKPALEIDLLHENIIADIACLYAFGLCVVCRASQCR
jgi:hypothetical protein